MMRFFLSKFFLLARDIKIIFFLFYKFTQKYYWIPRPALIDYHILYLFVLKPSWSIFI